MLRDFNGCVEGDEENWTNTRGNRGVKRWWTMQWGTLK